MGACVAAKITRSCFYGDKLSNTNEEEAEIFQEMKKYADPVMLGLVKIVLKNFPQSIKELKMMVREKVEMFAPEIASMISKFELIAEKTIDQVCNEIIIFIENTVFTVSNGDDLRPIKDMIDGILKQLHYVINAEDKPEVCTECENFQNLMERYLNNVDFNIRNLLVLRDLLLEFIFDFLANNSKITYLLENYVEIDTQMIEKFFTVAEGEPNCVPSIWIYVASVMDKSKAAYIFRKGEETMDKFCNAKHGSWQDWSTCTTSCLGGQTFRFK